jgi:hypothetical protein
MVPGFDAHDVDAWNTDNRWIELWSQILRHADETTFETLLADIEVTALPEGAIAFNHFLANYCCSDSIRESLHKQRQPL